MNKHILVTGMQRSGTTFTSSVLKSAKNLLYLPEPFNPNYGLIGVDKQYSYINLKDSNNINQLLIDDLFSYRACFKKNYINDNRIKKIAKFIFGSKTQLRYKKAKYFSGNNIRFLIKDPDAIFLSEYIHKNYNCQILFLIRHPVAVFASYKRLGWSVDFSNINNLMNVYNEDLNEFYPLINKKHKSLSEQVAILWICIYKLLHIFSKRNENWFIISHEEICNNPQKSFKSIFNWSNLIMTDKIVDYINDLTNYNNSILAQNNKLHDFKRNSKALLDYWKSQVDIEDINIIKNITDPVYSIYYRDKLGFNG